MKNLFLTAFILLTAHTVFAADFIKELENSINRKECKVTYTLHMGDGKEQIFTGHDFSSGGIIEKGSIPIYFEMYKGSGDKKQNIMININNAIYYKLNIEKVMGVWEYDFHFYYS
ncbi:MAG: hypothetical protein V4615_14460 [Bacteroidota bacterium]